MNQKISIIIPAFKTEKYIGKCLESVINQTYSNIEILAIVDSASPDKTEEIVREYAKRDNRIRVILQHGKKQGEARNGGLDEATGDYILFLDSDDWLSERCCEEVLDAVVNSGSQIVFFDFFKEYDKKSIPVFTYGRDWLSYSKDSKDFDIYDMRFVTPWGKLYSREIIGEERFDIDTREAEDVEFNFRIYANTSSALYIRKNLYHYRVQMNSAIHGFDETKIEKFDYTVNKIRYANIGKGEEREEACYSFCAIVYIVLCQNSIYLNSSIGLIEKTKRIAKLGNKDYFKDMFSHLDMVKIPLSRKVIPIFGKIHLYLGIIFVIWVKQIIEAQRR